LIPLRVPGLRLRVQRLLGKRFKVMIKKGEKIPPEILKQITGKKDDVD
jgi:hypothetical protein